MFEDMRTQFGVNAPSFMRPLPVDRVTEAVIRAVERDVSEILVMSGSPRAIVTAAAASPRLFERLAHRLNHAAPFDVAETTTTIE
jgi:hypothetical protein